jgi:plasmid maintenance system killer protein
MPDTTSQGAVTTPHPPPAGPAAIHAGGAAVDAIAIKQEIAAYDKKAALAALEEPSVGPAPVVEAPKVEVKPDVEVPAKKDEDIAEDKKLGYYTKWDKTLRTREEKLTAAEKAFADRYEPAAKRVDDFESAVAALQKDKAAGIDILLNLVGMTYDDVVEAKLAGKLSEKKPETAPAPQPVNVEEVVEQKIQAIEAKREERELVALRDEMQAKFDEILTSKADDFANVILNGDLAKDAAWQLYVERGQSDQPITEEQALDMVEEALVKQALQAENTKRFKAAKAQPQPKGESERKPANPIPASKLTNELGARSPLDVKVLPETERRKATYDAIAEYDRKKARERMG